MAGVDKRSKLFETAPEEVVRYFDERRSLPSFDWRDVAPGEHALGFTVAKTAGYDVLGDLRAATRKAVVDRIPFEKFRDELEPTLIAKGWWGKKSAIDPKTGETVTVQLGSPRRLRTIYWANTRSAHAAGEWERTERTKAFLPFLIYTLSTAEHKRPVHAAHARKPVVLPVDDPWWERWYPPNGWLCQCGVRQITRREAVARGYTPETVAPALDERPWLNKRTGEVEMVPNGIDPGWATNPGKRRERNVADHLAGRLDAMDEAARRTAIADMTGSKLFRAIQGGDIPYPPGKVDPATLTPGEMRRRNIAAPVAAIPEDVAAGFGAKTKVVRFSVADAAKQRGKRVRKTGEQMLRPEDYAQIQAAIDAGDIHRDGDGDLVVLTQYRGKWWQAVLRRTATGEEIFLKSFRPLRDRQLEAIRELPRLK